MQVTVVKVYSAHLVGFIYHATLAERPSAMRAEILILNKVISIFNNTAAGNATDLGKPPILCVRVLSPMGSRASKSGAACQRDVMDVVKKCQ